eukprot:5385999-Amphidinium_carterae.1
MQKGCASSETHPSPLEAPLATYPNEFHMVAEQAASLPSRLITQHHISDDIKFWHYQPKDIN